ncbi:SNF2-related protein, partial [mine drainage metagenome]
MTSYSLLARDISTLSALKWHRVVVDEAQNIKNPSAAMTVAANSLISSRRIALTGTPVENHTGELWAIMNFINPGLLGSRTGFRTKFSIPIERENNQTVATHLGKAIAPFLLRRLKTDKSIIADLPDKIEIKEYCGLSQEQEALYKNAVLRLQESLESASQMQRRGAILASITRLKQICNHPTLVKEATSLRGNSAKMQRLEELLEEILEGDEKVIIFTQFTTFGNLLHEHLQERFRQRVLYLHGGSTMPQRDSMVSEFATPGGPSIFLLSLKAGGTGLNLTAANHVIHYDRWWNSAVESQATD